MWSGPDVSIGGTMTMEKKVSRILVVDDEQSLRIILSQVLTDDGHDVTVAANGEEAIELFRENPHPELFDADGEINRGDYITMMFDPGFDPDEWDPETDIYRD